MGFLDFLKPKKKAWKPVPRVLTARDPRPEDMSPGFINPMNPISPFNPMYGDSMSGHHSPPSHRCEPPADCSSQSSTPDYSSPSDSGCSDGGGGGGGGD